MDNRQSIGASQYMRQFARVRQRWTGANRFLDSWEMPWTPCPRESWTSISLGLHVYSESEQTLLGVIVGPSTENGECHGQFSVHENFCKVLIVYKEAKLWEMTVGQSRVIDGHYMLSGKCSCLHGDVHRRTIAAKNAAKKDPPPVGFNISGRLYWIWSYFPIVTGFYHSK